MAITPYFMRVFAGCFFLAMSASRQKCGFLSTEQNIRQRGERAVGRERAAQSASRRFARVVQLPASSTFTQIRRLSLEIASLAPALLGDDGEAVVMPADSLVRAGVRRSNGATYVIAVNSWTKLETVRIGVVQIAGLVARRIVDWVKAGDDLTVGDRFGLIRFGSRVDVYLPAGTRVLVGLGQKAVAGEISLPPRELMLKAKETWDGLGAHPEWMRQALLKDGYRVAELKVAEPTGEESTEF